MLRRHQRKRDRLCQSMEMWTRLVCLGTASCFRWLEHRHGEDPQGGWWTSHELGQACVYTWWAGGESRCADDSVFAYLAVFNFAMCYLRNKADGSGGD